jgi:hypothetical protein
MRFGIVKRVNAMQGLRVERLNGLEVVIRGRYCEFLFIRVPEHREPYTETWFRKSWWQYVKREYRGVASDEREVFSPSKNLAVLCERRSLKGGDECDLPLAIKLYCHLTQ